jgi:hypothetical protein
MKCHLGLEAEQSDYLLLHLGRIYVLQFFNEALIHKRNRFMT